MASTPETTTCPHAKCAAPVILARIGPNLVRTLLDAERVSWQDGGRVRLTSIDFFDDSEPPIARKFQHAGQAFGNPLFRLHDETCKAVQKRARQKATSS